MTFFRLIAVLLPQLLISLLVAGSHDMLGGWNQTSDALTTVLALFLLSPAVSLALMITEVVRGCKAPKGERCRIFIFAVLAALLFVEALAIDLYFISQLRM